MYCIISQYFILWGDDKYQSKKCNMKRLFFFSFVLVAVCGMVFLSCKKDPVQEGQSAFRTTCGIFHVSESTAVSFATGNLHCDATAEPLKWWFAEHQYDWTGKDEYDRSDVEIFLWGPNDGSWGENKEYSGDDPARTTFDWGAVVGGGWRTLTSSEWRYIFDSVHRHTQVTFRDGVCPNACFARAIVNGTKGIILFPDGNGKLVIDLEMPRNINKDCIIDGAWNDTYTRGYSAENWELFEAAGCVFLPQAGYRRGSSMFYGSYWSSTGSDASSAHSVVFKADFLWRSMDFGRRDGGAVRLVRDQLVLF